MSLGLPGGIAHPGPQLKVDFFFIGDPELVTAFRFIGIRGKGVVNDDGAKAAFLDITQGRDETSGVILTRMKKIEHCQILIITEEVADWLGDILVQWQLSDQYPLVVEVPGMMGKLPGRKTLVESIREAIGIHV
ncbi:MAG: ATPase V [Treponema sp.]|nr:ATPase V [Treponema sp.]